MKYKTFTAEALLAADVNDLLMRQVIIEVDNNTQRGTIPAPKEGMVVYNKAAHRHEYFTGSIWVPLSSGNFPYVEYRLNAGQLIQKEQETTLDLDANPTVVRGTWAESSGIVTIPEPGEYLIETSHAWVSSGTTGTRYFIIYQNGLTQRIMTAAIPASTSDTIIQAATRYFAAGDTVRLRVYQNSGAALTVGEFGNPKQPILKIRKVGDRW